MSKSTVWVAGVAVILAAGALVLQFVLPAGGGSDSAGEIAALRSEIDTLKQAARTGQPLRIAYLNAESAFTVFTDAVSDLRQRAMEKQAQIVQLQQQYSASTISRDEYQRRSLELQAELLDAQLAIDIGTIDRMIASKDFADLRSDLERLREEAQPIVDEMKNLVATARVGVVDPVEFEGRYNQVKNAFSQLDQLLTQAAAAKIAQAAEKVALKHDYDLVLRVKNVIMYRNPATLVDITELVKAEISTYL